MEIVALPPLGVGAQSRFVSHDPRFTVERAWAVRGELLLRTLRTLRPGVVFVELFPFGRAKFARELVPLLELAREGGAMTACSLRDILVTGRDDQAGHDERACRLANAHLDAILVHSDPRFARLEETFGAADQLTVPIRYTGFVVGPTRSRPRERRVVVSAGGGLVGEPLLAAAIEAQRIGTGLPMRAIAGPLMPDDAFERLRAQADGVPELELLRSVPDLAGELARRRGGGQPGGLQHDARDRPHRRPRAGRPVCHAGGGRAAAAAPAGSPTSARCACSRTSTRRPSRARSGGSRTSSPPRRRSTSTAAAAPARSSGS